MIKRIVLRHPSGLYQILGIGPTSDTGEDEMPDDFIPVEAGVTVDGKAMAVNLIASKRTYWLYTPVMKPQGLKGFHEEQR